MAGAIHDPEIRDDCGASVEGELKPGTIAYSTPLTSTFSIQARPQSPEFSWWLAVVSHVVSKDQVRLAFPQYHSREDNLLEYVVIDRHNTTPMHGGLAGGVRIPTASEMEGWELMLNSNIFDMRVIIQIT